MCHLVSYFKPVKTSELNVLQTIVFDGLEAAKAEAASLALSGCTEVRVWKLVASPTLIPTVQWS